MIWLVNRFFTRFHASDQIPEYEIYNDSWWYCPCISKEYNLHKVKFNSSMISESSLYANNFDVQKFRNGFLATLILWWLVNIADKQFSLLKEFSVLDMPVLIICKFLIDFKRDCEAFRHCWWPSPTTLEQHFQFSFIYHCQVLRQGKFV